MEQPMNSAVVSKPVTEVEADLGFASPEDVIADSDGRGLKRAVTRMEGERIDRHLNYRRCKFRDWSAPGSPQPSLRGMGFESIDLSGIAPLQALLAQIRAAAAITPEQGRELRRHLRGRVFPLSEGKCLRLLSVAPEGLIMRNGGPNGLKINPDGQMTEMNGHDVAVSVHGDQDVRGTPLKQIMRGRAPLLFRHQTPDGSNLLSPLMLVNLWIPLQQITRPLTFMDRRTLNAREHQLRYALPTDSFLDRSEEMRMNDIWTFLHDDAQQWYFHSNLDHRTAYVFDTLGEPHGAIILPGEAIAEQYYLQLRQLSEQLRAGVTPPAPAQSVPELPPSTTAALRRAIAHMQELIACVPRHNIAAVDNWLARAAQAMDALVRRSLEMRVVALLLPNAWPFNRPGKSHAHA
jgi:hypothetical protein